jgi:hypothetical protein
MDKPPMPETLDTLAAKLTELSTSITERFAKVDQQFAKVDERFATAEKQRAEMKAHLEVKIEAVQADVRLVYDVVIAQQERNKANDRAHRVFTKRLDNHDIRILALEPPEPPKPSER